MVMLISDPEPCLSHCFSGHASSGLPFDGQPLLVRAACWTCAPWLIIVLLNCYYIEEGRERVRVLTASLSSRLVLLGPVLVVMVGLTDSCAANLSYCAV
jgi:hypothetical protein